MNQQISEAITRLLNNDATLNTSVTDGQLRASDDQLTQVQAVSQLTLLGFQQISILQRRRRGVDPETVGLIIRDKERGHGIKKCKEEARP